MKEKDLVRQIKEYLDLYEKRGKLYYIRNNTGAIASAVRFIRFGKPGSSDFIVFTKQKPFFLEAKADKGKLSESQLTFKGAVRALGYAYFMVKDIREVESIVKENI
jgi:hypothetical protein